MLLYRDHTDNVLGGFYSVYRGIRHGHAEIFYRRAMVRELTDRKCDVGIEVPFNVAYKNDVVGVCKVDLLVDDLIVVELKAARVILDEHIEQLYAYLLASPVGLVLNFGPKPSFKRLIGPGWK